MDKRTKRREATRRWRERYPERARESAQASKIKFKYGVTREQYNQMLCDQDGKCAICETEIPGGKGRFHVDHNHLTNRIRGLLCHNCNLMIGHAKDQIDILQKAIAYLI